MAQTSQSNPAIGGAVPTQYYPTPERVVDLIAELIHTPTGYYHRGRETIRILDPCCGAGDALERLAERLDRPNALSIETYGVELHRDRAEEAEKGSTAPWPPTCSRPP